MGTAAPRMDVDALVLAARALAPRIRALRGDIERERSLPAPLVKEMAEAGFFSLGIARGFGGLQLDAVDILRVVEELSRADGSVGWCAMVAANASRISGYLDERVARAIFDGGRTIVAGSLNPSGKAVAAPGGFRVTGTWTFGSFIHHSAWTVGNCIVHDGDAPRHNPDGAPEIRLMVFPTSAVDILDTWHVAGMRGTGSHDFRVADLFVPRDHSFDALTAKPVQPGTLYAAPLMTLLAVSIAGTSIGIARAAIDAFIDLAAAKTPRGAAVRLRDKPTAQADIGRAEALLCSARAFLFDATRDIWRTVTAGNAATLPQRAAARLAASHAAFASAQAVDLLFNAAGGTALYAHNPIERCFRDVHATTQHVATNATNFENGGRVLLGVDTINPSF